MKTFNLQKALAGAKLVTRNGLEVHNFRKYCGAYRASIGNKGAVPCTSDFSASGRRFPCILDSEYDLFLAEDDSNLLSDSDSAFLAQWAQDNVNMPPDIAYEYKDFGRTIWKTAIFEKVPEMVLSKCLVRRVKVPRKIYFALLQSITSKECFTIHFDNKSSLSKFAEDYGTKIIGDIEERVME